MYAYDVTKNLYAKMKEYDNQFGDIVPLMEIPGDMTEEKLIEKIDLAISEKKKIIEFIPEMKNFYDEEKNMS